MGDANPSSAEPASDQATPAEPELIPTPVPTEGYEAPVEQAAELARKLGIPIDFEVGRAMQLPIDHRHEVTRKEYETHPENSEERKGEKYADAASAQNRKYIGTLPYSMILNRTDEEHLKLHLVSKCLIQSGVSYFREECKDPEGRTHLYFKIHHEKSDCEILAFYTPPGDCVVVLWSKAVEDSTEDRRLAKVLSRMFERIQK